MAVGNEFDPATGQSLGTVAERWDGRTWRIVPTFKPAPAGPNAFLNGVACTSATACTAVGNQTLAKTLAERWNGHTWSIQPTPSPADGGNLIGVSCPSRASCLAVGGHGNPFTGPALGTLAERWDGARWRIQLTPNPPGGGWFLLSVSCTSPSACTAVGGRLVPTRTGLATLAERWNGHTWSIQPTPTRPVTVSSS